MRSKIRHQLPRLSKPDMAPLANFFLVISCFFLLTSTLKEPSKGLVALEETPRTPCNTCFNVSEHTKVFVCLTASGRVSFATSESSLQRAILRQVGKKHGVHFSTVGLARLASMAFLAVRLEVLSPTPLHMASQEVPESYALTEAQLLDCIESAKVFSLKLTGRPAGIYLSIDAKAKVSLVMQLVKLFQQRKINRLNLLTHCYT